ncbi:hypothetical protein D9M72_593710 [compost metagenome]
MPRQFTGEVFGFGVAEEVVEEGHNPRGIAGGQGALGVAQWLQIDVTNHIVTTRFWQVARLARPKGWAIP